MSDSPSHSEFLSSLPQPPGETSHVFNSLISFSHFALFPSSFPTFRLDHLSSITSSTCIDNLTFEFENRIRLFKSPGWPSFYFLLCHTGGRVGSFLTGGTGIIWNHDNGAHEGSDCVFYSLIWALQNEWLRMHDSARKLLNFYCLQVPISYQIS